MKLNAHLIPMALVLALVLGMAGCKNDSTPATDDKSYIVDPGDGKLPDTSPDPCVAKDAAGAMELLLKGKCGETAKPPVCGNFSQEDGEQCDPPDGKICDIKCQKIVEGVKAPEPTSTIKILTEKIKDGKMGAAYLSESIAASGKKANDSYTWSAASAPEGFELKLVGETAKIASKGPAKQGAHTAVIKACLKSKATDCAEKSYSFAINDELNLTATRSTGAKPVCVSGGLSCSKLVLDPKSNINGFVNKNGPKFLLIFNVKGLVKDDKSFQWGLSHQEGAATVDAPRVKAADQLLCNPLIKVIDASCEGKEQHFPDGIFLMEPKHGDDGASTYQRHYLMFGPGAYGKTYNNVVLTVKNDLGGVQKLSFPAITIPKLEEVQAQQTAKVEAKKKEDAALLEKCSNLQVTGLTINEQTVLPQPGVDSNNEKFYKFDIPGFRIDKIYGATFTVTGGNGSYKVSKPAFTHPPNNTYTGEPSVDGLTITWPKFKKAAKVSGDTTILDISDTSDVCLQTAKIVVLRTAGYPTLEEEKISDLKSIKVSVGVLDVEDQSKFTIILLDQDGKELAKTAAISAGDRTDPAVYNETYPLTVVKDAPLSSFVKIKVYIQDPGMGSYMDVWLFGYTMSTQYRMINVGDLSAYVKWSGLFDELWEFKSNDTLGTVEAGGKTGSFTVDVTPGQWNTWPSTVVP